VASNRRPTVTVAEYASQAARLAHVQDLLAQALESLRGLPECQEHSRATLSVVNAQHALHRLHDELDHADLVPSDPDAALDVGDYPAFMRALEQALRPN
jgi:hypothetical protein